MQIFICDEREPIQVNIYRQPTNKRIDHLRCVHKNSFAFILIVSLGWNWKRQLYSENY